MESGGNDIKGQRVPTPTGHKNTRPHLSSQNSRQSNNSHRNSNRGKSIETGSRPCHEHTFLTDVADVRQMEQGLLQLLDDFHLGKLQAFGQDCPFEKMDQVREQQERLARLHFELDCQQEIRGYESNEAKETANQNMSKLMDNLEELCTSIHTLQRSDHAAVSSHSQQQQSRGRKHREKHS